MEYREVEVIILYLGEGWHHAITDMRDSSLHYMLQTFFIYINHNERIMHDERDIILHQTFL